MKRCTRCNLLKPDEDFRLRKQTKKNLHSYVYRESNCKQCENERQKERYLQIKDIPEFIKLNRDRSKKYRKENIIIVTEKDKIRRQTESHKENRKKYIEKNKDKIINQEKITKRRYHEKHRDTLSDNYVLSKIINKSTLSKNEIPPTLIKLKRLQIKCKRTLKTIKK